jgi:hypothetical protein
MGLKGEDYNGGYYSSPEWRAKLKQDKYFYANMLPLERARIELGQQWGFVPVVMSQLAKDPLVAKEWANSLEGAKDFLLVPLLHDCLIQPHWENVRPGFDTWLARDKFGIADEDVEFFAYWKNEKFVKSSDENVKVSFYTKKGKIMLIVGNVSKIKKDVIVRVNLNEIGGVKHAMKVFDAVTDEKIEFENETLKISLPPRDYQMIIIEG